ncbi:hypothetical protein FXN61_23960 [Lentzea sp. PSKA42]|uniref:Uncharacterized protein n=1 Tax=Lentzea indica TaxID=2604800 RepID=A0ABX1FMC2_9PSEU|nr:hypothetical protein [Lentzea indica]NKE59698.1 hypothetical protein [Lentzea indica]
MSNLPELLKLAARVVRDHPDAPRVASVSVDYRGVRVQIGSVHDSLRPIAKWAQALRTTVEITPHSNFYGATATKSVDVAGVGETCVVVWTHLELAEILMLARDLGVVVGATSGSVEITPQRLLTVLDAGLAEGRVA